MPPHPILFKNSAVMSQTTEHNWYAQSVPTVLHVCTNTNSLRKEKQRRRSAMCDMRSAHLTDPHTHTEEAAGQQITVPKIRNINKRMAFQFQHPRLFVHVMSIIKLSSIIIRNKTTPAKQHCSPAHAPWQPSSCFPVGKQHGNVETPLETNKWQLFPCLNV